MEYSTLTYSPGRDPTRPEEAEASLSVKGKQIDLSTDLTETP